MVLRARWRPIVLVVPAAPNTSWFLCLLLAGEATRTPASSRGFGAFCRSFVAGVGFSSDGARESLCPGAWFVDRGGGSSSASSTTSSMGALVLGPRWHGECPGRRATAIVPRRSRWGSPSTLKARFGDGAILAFWEDGGSAPSPASRGGGGGSRASSWW